MKHSQERENSIVKKHLQNKSQDACLQNDGNSSKSPENTKHHLNKKLKGDKPHLSTENPKYFSKGTIRDSYAMNPIVASAFSCVFALGFLSLIRPFELVGSYGREGLSMA